MFLSHYIIDVMISHFMTVYYFMKTFKKKKKKVIYFFLLMSTFFPVALIVEKETYRANECNDLNELSGGSWDFMNRTYTPPHCRFSKMTPTLGRTCLQNKTILFIGDSQVRDLGSALAWYLSGVEVHDASNDKMDIRSGHHPSFNYQIQIQHDIRIVPFPNNPYYEFNSSESWRVGYSFWQHPSQNSVLERLLSGEAGLPENVFPFPVAFIFANSGLHAIKEWWHQIDETRSGPFYTGTLRPYLRSVSSMTIAPCVWVPCNRESLFLLSTEFKYQANATDEINLRARNELKNEGALMWDSNFFFPSSTDERINYLQADGVHVKQWVDILRIKIFLSIICAGGSFNLDRLLEL